VFTSSQPEDLQVQIPSHISTTADSITTLDLTSLEPVTGGQVQNWKRKMLQHKDVFSQEKQLGENVVIKIWGMVSLPASRLFATSFSLHPTKTVEYLIPSDALSTILITCSPDELDITSLKSSALSEAIFNAEVMGFTIKFYLSLRPSPERRSAIMEILNTDFVSSEPKINEDMPPGSSVANLRAAFQTPAMRKERFKRLVLIFGDLPDEGQSLAPHGFCPHSAPTTWCKSARWLTAKVLTFQP
jgi:hypothetical protein